jgi:hypothetical protein
MGWKGEGAPLSRPAAPGSINREWPEAEAVEETDLVSGGETMNLSIALALSALMSLEHSAAGEAAEAFTRLRLLQGNWRGTYAWTGARERWRDDGDLSSHRQWVSPDRRSFRG